MPSHPSQAFWDMLPAVLDSIALPQIPQRDYLLADFGLVEQEQADLLPALRAAITQAARDGGGRIIIPPGEWTCNGPIHMKSNCELHFCDDAVLTFSAHASDYLPAVLTRWEGTEVFNYSPLIYAYLAHNIAISGRGVIHGNAHVAFKDWRSRQDPAKQRLRKLGAIQAPLYERIFGEGDFLRPSMIQCIGCNRVLIEGVHIFDSPFWVNHLIASSDITLRQVTVESAVLNNDGIDLESCNRVLVEGCHLSTGDDSIVIKSGRDADGWRLGRASEDIVIRNNFLQGHNGLAIGSEMSGGVRRVFMQDNELGDTRGSLYFKSNPDRGGTIEDVGMRRIRVKSSLNPLIQFRTNYQRVSQGPYPPHFHRIYIEDVIAGQVAGLVSLCGTAERPLSEIYLRNIHAEQSSLPPEKQAAAMKIDAKACHIASISIEDVRLADTVLTVEGLEG